MVKSKKTYNRLKKHPLFTLIDYVQGKRVSADNAILINGFWRSGTTYFMEYLEKLLDRRAFFEPMHYSVKQARALHTPMGFTIKGDELMQCHPFMLPEAKNSEYDAFYEAMLRGQVSTPWTRRNRYLSLSLKKDVIVKSVRSNFLAPYLSNRYGVKNVFIIRHPAAVLSSIIRKGSGVKSIYKSLGSEIFLNLLIQEIRNCDPTILDNDMSAAIKRYRGDNVNNVILSWCLSNYVPLKYINEGLYSPLLINFESFFLDDITKSKLFEYFSIDSSIDIPSFNSSTTDKERKQISAYSRLYSWQKDLTAGQVKKVYDICSCFGKEIEKTIHIADSYK